MCYHNRHCSVVKLFLAMTLCKKSAVTSVSNIITDRHEGKNYKKKTTVVKKKKKGEFFL